MIVGYFDSDFDICQIQLVEIWIFLKMSSKTTKKTLRLFTEVFLMSINTRRALIKWISHGVVRLCKGGS